MASLSKRSFMTRRASVITVCSNVRAIFGSRQMVPCTSITRRHTGGIPRTPKMTETRTVHDPFLGKDVQIHDRLVDRLRGNYACGPHLPNGRPEFGWRQFQAPPIQHEAAARIELLESALKAIKRATLNGDVCDDVAWFDQIETLHDFCDRILASVEGGG